MSYLDEYLSRGVTPDILISELMGLIGQYNDKANSGGGGSSSGTSSGTSSGATSNGKTGADVFLYAGLGAALLGSGYFLTRKARA